MPHSHLRPAPRLLAVRTGSPRHVWAQILTLALLCLGLSATTVGEPLQTPPSAPATLSASPAALPRLLLAAAPTEAAPPDSESQAATQAPVSPERAQCLRACAQSSGQCSSEVRQARQECSRNAANGGRDPLSMRNDEYAYFCSYFTQPGRCAFGDCQRRFTGHLNVCLNVMQKNIASMRHDCFRNERDAQRICRNELRACEASCPQ